MICQQVVSRCYRTPAHGFNPRSVYVKPLVEKWHWARDFPNTYVFLANHNSTKCISPTLAQWVIFGLITKGPNFNSP
jgi:hypothetical protein